MRRRLNRAALGTFGVLAVATVVAMAAVAMAAVMIGTGEPEQAASPKIIVPITEDAVIDLPPPATTRPSTVFIDVPPVAVVSETVTSPPPATPLQTTVPAPKKPSPGTNLALGKPINVSGSQNGYPPNNANDGNVNSYWESTNNAFPQTITVDLGAALAFNRVTLKVPPLTVWGARTQTLTVSGGNEAGSYSTLVASRGYTFDPASGNTASVTFAATTQRFVRLTITGNTGWPAGQVSELEVAAA